MKNNCCPPKDPCVICPVKPANYAYYSQNGRLYNRALFGGLFFENPPVQTDGFYYDTGIIQILNPGTYLASYLVNFPAGATVDTRLALQLNNQNLTGTVRTVEKTVTGIPFTASAQVIFQIDSISAVRLSSSAIIDLHLPEEDTAASLLILQL